MEIKVETDDINKFVGDKDLVIELKLTMKEAILLLSGKQIDITIKDITFELKKKYVS